ncbi:rhodanese-like domain-containing protein, partial [Candidatus Gottesmanbacteria bacterium]|nr:rhodanese-like domain-containing protein [Candidatus Gottesmanbacteria bacterium]
LPFDKTTPIILYCKTGKMSGEAVVTLQKMGYLNVRHLEGGMNAWQKIGGKILDLSKLEQEVIPEQGAEMPVTWGEIGPKLVSLGVIDPAKLKQVLDLKPEQKIKIDRNNVRFVVDILWALGLAQKSLVYDEGPMGVQYKKDAGNFASTGGWTLGRAGAMNYYNKFDLIPLTFAQQKQVAEISKNVYRACCGNSTYFPDCNHGMAALAMIELMVSNNIDEKTLYKTLLAFNSYWFPDTYLTTATYFARQGIAWKDVDPKRIMGAEFSSGQGAADIAKKVGTLPWKTKSGSSCGA